MRIPKVKMKSYYRFFNIYNFARTLIDTIEYLQIGQLIVDKPLNPNILRYSIPYFHVLAGNPETVLLKEFLKDIPINETFFIPNVAWIPILEKHFCEDGIKIIQHTYSHFDSSKLSLEHVLKTIKKRPKGYTLEKLDLEATRRIDSQFAPHFISSFFGNPERFISEGVGFYIKKGDKIASYAASLFPYQKKLEIHVNTDKKHRKKGLGLIVSAKLIEYCIYNSIIPNLEAIDNYSAKLAEKLGYINPANYNCYSLTK